MKTVLSKKRNLGFKDFLKIALFTFFHYSFFAFYILIILLTHFYSVGGSFFPNKITSSNWLLLYSAFLAPAISVSMHILYNQKGLIWPRVFLLVQGIINLALVPIAIYL